MMLNLIVGVIGGSYGRIGIWDLFRHCLQVIMIFLLAYLKRSYAASLDLDMKDFLNVSFPPLAHADS